MQPLKDNDHHRITLAAVKFSSDAAVNTPSPTSRYRRRHERSTAPTQSSIESSDDEFYDADEQLSPGHSSIASAGASLAPAACSISAANLEGDPPDIEEDRDFTESEDISG